MTVRELIEQLRNYKDDAEIQFWGGVEDVDVTPDEHCLCYSTDRFYKRPVCLGTRECDPCYCEGFKSKCSFYEHYRNAPVTDSIIYIRPIGRNCNDTDC